MQRVAFTRANAALAATFECGSEPFAQEVADFIRGEDDAVWIAIEKFGAEVWLYLTDDATEVIGFASLALQQVYNADSGHALGPALVLPYLGVHTRFRKQPPGDYAQYYTRQIFRDLLAEARRHPAGLPKLVLYVHPDNSGAIRLYSDPEFGFVKVSEFVGYDCMVADLTH